MTILGEDVCLVDASHLPRTVPSVSARATRRLLPPISIPTTCPPPAPTCAAPDIVFWRVLEKTVRRLPEALRESRIETCLATAEVWMIDQLICIVDFESTEEALDCPDFRVTTWALCLDLPASIRRLPN